MNPLILDVDDREGKCQALFEHPVRKGVPAWSCPLDAIEGSIYCQDHQGIDEGGLVKPPDLFDSDWAANHDVQQDKNFQFSEEFMKFTPDYAAQHNDAVDASASAWLSLPEARLPDDLIPKDRSWFFNFLWFMIGFGVGLMAAYLFYLLQVMNP